MSPPRPFASSPAGSRWASPVGVGLPERVGRLAQLFARLPGVGEKTALRFALHLSAGDDTTARELGRELGELRDHVRSCVRCGNIAEAPPGTAAVCAICTDPRRDAGLLCVVARTQDLLAIERSGAMRGRYFVLGKLLSPLEGVGTQDLPLEALRGRVTGESGLGPPDQPAQGSPASREPAEPRVIEVLVATPPSVDGEATALLIARALSALGVRVSRIASGIPHGGDLEFADQVTLGRAIEGRKSFG